MQRDRGMTEIFYGH